ncbi:box C/D snoRNA protein 1-like [Watersipora subatra]|uniref:box C/D snoRNA protein 1-like n=1 Tax=Watersipora subatra TaxID=2589382 RepID=UPI00355B49D5
MGLCEVCRKEPRKYTCPGCSMNTCSLPCVKLHKRTNSCDGKRKVTDFIKLDEFTDKNLHDDMHFLEGTERKLRRKNDGPLTLPGSSNHGNVFVNPGSARCSQAVLAKLMKAAAMRSITLKLSPFLTTRRRSNSTHCNCRNAHQVNEHTKMFWHIQWICEGKKLEERSVDENILLTDAVQRLSDSIERRAKDGAKDTEMSETCLFVAAFDKLQASTDSDLLRVAMLAEHRHEERSIYLLDKTLSLRDNFRGKIIIEHPILMIMPNEQLSKYAQL